MELLPLLVMPDFASPEVWLSLLTLTFLEIVLGIDNIIFIAIAAGKLPHDQQAKATNIGMILAMVMRIALLFGITWLIGLEHGEGNTGSKVKTTMSNAIVQITLINIVFSFDSILTAVGAPFYPDARHVFLATNWLYVDCRRSTLGAFLFLRLRDRRSTKRLFIFCYFLLFGSRIFKYEVKKEAEACTIK